MPQKQISMHEHFGNSGQMEDTLHLITLVSAVIPPFLFPPLFFPLLTI